MYLEKLGVYGWQGIEKYCLASLLTGDPLLLIGEPGTNKTGAARVLSQALGLPFASYNAAMAVFDEVLGFPNVKDLSEGFVSYIETPRTIWGKQFILVDELNRAAPELQSKWLELIRSREMMGTKTGTECLWSAINPSETDEGAGELLAPVLSRFAFFLEVPTIWDLNEEERIKVGLYQGNDDAPALSRWGVLRPSGTTPDFVKVGEEIKQLLEKAAVVYEEIREDFGHRIGRFVAQFGEELAKRTSGEIVLTGRSVGLLVRSMIATWAIEVVMGQEKGEEVDFAGSVCGVLMNCIPLADGDAAISRKDAQRQIENLFWQGQFAEYFRIGGDLEAVSRMYRLICSSVLGEKIKIILTEGVDDLVKFQTFTDIINSEEYLPEVVSGAFQVVIGYLNKHQLSFPAELRRDIEQNIKPLPVNIAFTGIPLTVIPDVKKHVVDYLNGIDNLVLRGMALAIIKNHMANNPEGLFAENLKAWVEEADTEVRFFQTLL